MDVGKKLNINLKMGNDVVKIILHHAQI